MLCARPWYVPGHAVAAGCCQTVAGQLCAETAARRRLQGPRGMDKLVYDARGTTISNDGATIMKARPLAARRLHTRCALPSLRTAGTHAS